MVLVSVTNQQRLLITCIIFHLYKKIFWSFQNIYLNIYDFISSKVAEQKIRGERMFQEEVEKGRQEAEKELRRRVREGRAIAEKNFTRLLEEGKIEAERQYQQTIQEEREKGEKIFQACPLT